MYCMHSQLLFHVLDSMTLPTIWPVNVFFSHTRFELTSLNASSPGQILPGMSISREPTWRNPDDPCCILEFMQASNTCKNNKLHDLCIVKAPCHLYTSNGQVVCSIRVKWYFEIGIWFKNCTSDSKYFFCTKCLFRSAIYPN